MAKFVAAAVFLAIVAMAIAQDPRPQVPRPGLNGQGPVRPANAPAGKTGDLDTANSFYGGYGGFGYPGFYGGYGGYGYGYGYPIYGGGYYGGGYGYGYPFYG